MNPGRKERKEVSVMNEHEMNMNQEQEGKTVHDGEMQPCDCKQSLQPCDGKGQHDGKMPPEHDGKMPPPPPHETIT